MNTPGGCLRLSRRIVDRDVSCKCDRCVSIQKSRLDNRGHAIDCDATSNGFLYCECIIDAAESKDSCGHEAAGAPGLGSHAFNRNQTEPSTSSTMCVEHGKMQQYVQPLAAPPPLSSIQPGSKKSLWTKQDAGGTNLGSGGQQSLGWLDIFHEISASAQVSATQLRQSSRKFLQWKKSSGGQALPSHRGRPKAFKKSRHGQKSDSIQQENSHLVKEATSASTAPCRHGLTRANHVCSSIQETPAHVALSCCSQHSLSSCMSLTCGGVGGRDQNGGCGCAFSTGDIVDLLDISSRSSDSLLSATSCPPACDDRLQTSAEAIRPVLVEGTACSRSVVLPAEADSSASVHVGVSIQSASPGQQRTDISGAPSPGLFPQQTLRNCHEVSTLVGGSVARVRRAEGNPGLASPFHVCPVSEQTAAKSAILPGLAGCEVRRLEECTTGLAAVPVPYGLAPNGHVARANHRSHAESTGLFPDGRTGLGERMREDASSLLARFHSVVDGGEGVLKECNALEKLQKQKARAKDRYAASLLVMKQPTKSGTEGDSETACDASNGRSHPRMQEAGLKQGLLERAKMPQQNSREDWTSLDTVEEGDFGMPMTPPPWEGQRRTTTQVSSLTTPSSDLEESPSKETNRVQSDIAVANMREVQVDMDHQSASGAVLKHKVECQISVADSGRRLQWDQAAKLGERFDPVGQISQVLPTASPHQDCHSPDSRHVVQPRLPHGTTPLHAVKCWSQDRTYPEQERATSDSLQTAAPQVDPETTPPVSVRAMVQLWAEEGQRRSMDHPSQGRRCTPRSLLNSWESCKTDSSMDSSLGSPHGATPVMETPREGPVTEGPRSPQPSSVQHPVTNLPKSSRPLKRKSNLGPTATETDVHRLSDAVGAPNETSSAGCSTSPRRTKHHQLQTLSKPCTRSALAPPSRNQPMSGEALACSLLKNGFGAQARTLASPSQPASSNLPPGQGQCSTAALPSKGPRRVETPSPNSCSNLPCCDGIALPGDGSSDVQRAAPASSARTFAPSRRDSWANRRADVAPSERYLQAVRDVQPFFAEVRDCWERRSMDGGSSQAPSPVQHVPTGRRVPGQHPKVCLPHHQAQSHEGVLVKDSQTSCGCLGSTEQVGIPPAAEQTQQIGSHASRAESTLPIHASPCVKPFTAAGAPWEKHGSDIPQRETPSIVQPLSMEVHDCSDHCNSVASSSQASSSVQPLSGTLNALWERSSMDAAPSQRRSSVRRLSADVHEFLECRKSVASPSQISGAVRPLSAEALAFLESGKPVGAASKPSTVVRPLSAEVHAFWELRSKEASPAPRSYAVRPLPAEALAFLERCHSDAFPCQPPPTVGLLSAEALAFLERRHSDAPPSQPPPTVRPLPAEALAFLERRHCDASPSQPPPTVRPLHAEALAFLERRHCDSSPSQPPPTVRPLSAEVLAFLERHHSDASPSPPPPTVRPLPTEALAFLEGSHSDPSPSQAPPTVRPLSAEVLAFLECRHSDTSPSPPAPTVRPLPAEALAFLERRHSDPSPSQALPTVRPLPAEALAFLECRHSDTSASQAPPSVRPLPAEALAFLKHRHSDTSPSQPPPTVRPLSAEALAFLERHHSDASPSQLPSTARPLSAQALAFLERHHSDASSSQPLATVRSLAAEMLAFMDSRKPEGAPSRPSSCMRALPPDAHAFLQRLALDASQSESLSTAQPLPADMHQFWENCNTALSASTASSAAGPFSLKVHAFWNSNVSPLPTSSVVRPLSTGREASCQRSSSGAFPPRASSTGRPRSSQSTLCLDRLEARFSGNVWAAMLQGYPSSLGQPCPKEFEAGRGSHREESLPECSPSAEQSTPRACRGMDDTAAHTLLNAHHLSPEQHALRTREGSEVVSTASAVVQHVAPKVHDGCQHQGGDVPHGRTPCAVRPLSAEECQLWEACSTDSVQMHCTLSVRSTLQLGEAQAAGEDCGTYVQAASDPSIVSCSSTSYGTGPVPALALAIGDGECSVELSMKDQVHSMCEANCAVAGEADWGSSVPLEGDDRGNWERAHGDEASVLGQFGNVAAGQRHCEPSRVGEGESIGAMLDNVEEEESDDCWEDAISSDEVSEANVALEGPCPAEAEGAECGQHTEWYTARDGDDLSTLWEDCLLDADGDIPSVSKGECGPHDAGDVPQPVGFCTDAACPVGGAVQQDEGEQHRCQCNCDEQRPQNRPEAAPSLKLELSPASARTAHAEELQVQEAAVDFSSHHPHGAEDTNSRRVCAECKVPNQVLSPTGPKEEATLAQYPMLQGRFDLVCGSDGTRDARPTGQLQDNLLQPGRVVCTGDPHVLLLALDEAQPSAHPSTPVVQARDGPGCRAEGDARQKPEGYIPIIGASCPEGLMEGALGKEDVPSCGPQLKQSSDTVLETASMQELQMLPNEDGYILDRRDQQTLRGNFAANAEERGGINGGHPCGASAPRACPGRCAQGPPQPAEILHSKPEVAPDLFVEACPQPEGLPHTGEHLDAALEPYNGLARREVCVPLQSTRAQAWEEACELRPAVSVLKRIGCQDASLLQPTHGPAYSGKAFALGKLPSEEDCLVPSLWLAGQQVRDGPCDGAPTLPGFTVVPVSQRCHTRRALQAAEEGACWTAAAPCKASNPAECMKFHLETAQKAPAFEDRLCSEGAPSPSVTSQVNLYSLPASPTGQKPLLESPIPPTIATELPMASQLAGSSSWERQRQQELHQDNPAHARTAQDSQLYTVCASTLSWEPQLDKPFAHSTAKDSRLHSPAPSVGTIRCEPQMHTAITGDTAREPSRANPTVGAACRKPQLDNLAGTRSCQLQQDTGAADTAQLEGFTALAPATGSQLHFTAGPAVPLDLQSNPSASARTGECSSIYACFSNVVAMECASDLLGKSGMIVAGIGPEESTEQQLGGLNDEAKAAHQSGWQLALQQALRAAMDTPLMNSTCSVSQSPTGAGFESGSGKHPKPSNVGLDGPLPSLRFSGDQGVVSRVLAPDGGPSEAGLQICGHLQPLMTQPPELSREVERRSCIEEMEKVWVSGDDTARRHPGSGSPGHSDVPAFEEFVLAPSEVRNRFDDVSHGGAGPGGGHRRVRGQRDSRWLRLLGFGITQGYHIAGATVGIVEGMNSVAWSGIGACQNSLPGPLDVILNKGRVVTSR